MVVRLDTVSNKSYSMELNIEEGRLVLSSDCQRLFDTVMDILNRDNMGDEVSDRTVHMYDYYSKPLFKELLKIGLGMEDSDFTVVGGMYMFDVPRGLDLVSFDELMSFDGIVAYLKGREWQDLPWEIKRDINLLSYFNGCPVCCGDEHTVGTRKGDVLYVHIRSSILSYHTFNGYRDEVKVKYCPECGMKLA